MASGGIVALLVLVGGAVLVAFYARLSFVRGQVRRRLQAPVIGLVDDTASTQAARPVAPPVQTIFRRYRAVPWIVAAIVGIVCYFVFSFMAVYCVTIAVMVFVMMAQVESTLVEKKKAKIDNQLADALDQMISAIRAGGSVMAAMERAAEEGKPPLKTEFQSSLGLIRYGDDSASVMRRLMERVPLESFRLFAITMAVHFEVGGSLAPTLAIVAGIVRDKIEIAGRIRSLTAQSRASTITLVILTYGIAILMWYHDPPGVKEFVTSTAGSIFVAGSMIGEAVGFVWLSAMAKIK